MSEDRRNKLEKNFFKIFFINALLNVKMINIIISLFYVYRSLRVADIFYLGIVYSATVIISEVPSSYLADRFGRKRTLIMAVFFGFLHWVFFLVADSFLLFSIGIFFYALSGSFISGTDEAFVYDTDKELGNHGQSLRSLGRYFSSERVFKIFSAFLGVFIAKDLVNWQFNLIIMVDIAATMVAMVFAFTLVEPNHFMDVEKKELGLIKDAYKIVSKDRKLRSAIFNKLLVFTGGVICYNFSAVFFVNNLSVPIITLGIIWSIQHIFIFTGNRTLHLLWPSKSDGFKISILNVIFSVSLGLFLISWFFFSQKYILLGLYVISQIVCNLKEPVFSHIFNANSHSYNRATTLSLANFLQNIFQIPVWLLVGWLIDINIVYPYVIAFILGFVTVFYFKVNTKELKQTYVAKIV